MPESLREVIARSFADAGTVADVAAGEKLPDLFDHLTARIEEWIEQRNSYHPPASSDVRVQEIRDAIDSLEAWAEMLDHGMYDVDSLPIEHAIAYYAKLIQVRKKLRQSEAGLARWIAEVFRHQGWRAVREFDGIGLVEVNRPVTRTQWQHDDLLRTWLATLLRDRDGEIPPPTELLRLFREVAQVGGWKAGALRSMGIDVDEFSTVGRGAPKVDVTP